MIVVPPGCTNHHHKLAIFLYDRRRHGAEHSFVRFDLVSRSTGHTKHIWNTGLRAEIVHLIVEEEAEPPTTTLEPNQPLRVVVTATAFPCASTIEKCVVSSDSYPGILPGFTSVLGVALSGLKVLILSVMYWSSMSVLTGI